MGKRFIDEMGISVDRDADVPVGVQLAWALRGAIRSGALRPGDRFPPLRELADEVGVNANTLRAAYARLEVDGLIETRHGSGTFVATEPGGRDLAPLVAAANRAARDAGVDPRDLAAALYVNQVPAPKRDETAHRRRALREEIATLDRILAEVAPEPMPATAGTLPARGPQILSLEELVEVRLELLARLAAAIDPVPPVRDEPKADMPPAPAKARRTAPAPPRRVRPSTA